MGDCEAVGGDKRGVFAMDSIFHEKQEGSLCAQHCLNSLLQGPYFTAVDLSTLGQRLDEAERDRMAECGEESEDYQRFLRQPSGNMDDSGYFSVQVICSALEVWGLELVPYSSTTDERVRLAPSEPCSMQAFICNYKDHWFTVRKMGGRWYNLNSLLRRPQPISDTYLALFLAQLKNDGYSIFVVFGDLPECEADNPEPPPAIPDYDGDLAAALQMSRDVDSSPETDEELQKALALSMQGPVDSDSEDAMLKKAINMSLEC